MLVALFRLASKLKALRLAVPGAYESSASASRREKLRRDSRPPAAKLKSRIVRSSIESCPPLAIATSELDPFADDFFAASIRGSSVVKTGSANTAATSGVGTFLVISRRSAPSTEADGSVMISCSAIKGADVSGDDN